MHACLPKDDWLARRDLTGIHWPVYGRPGTLEYDQGPENVARGIQRGLRRYGIAAKVRATGHPEQHGTIERLIGTMMQAVHALRGTTFSNINERGESEPDKRACLSLPELERVLALTIDSYNHTTHASIGERPMDRYLAYYRRPDLPDSERVPPRLPAERLLLDFLPYETRALTRSGIRLFRVDYSSVDLLPLWRRDNQRRVARIVVYDPRSLARVWVLDEVHRRLHPDPLPRAASGHDAGPEHAGAGRSARVEGTRPNGAPAVRESVRHPGHRGHGQIGNRPTQGGAHQAGNAERPGRHRRRRRWPMPPSLRRTRRHSRRPPGPEPLSRRSMTSSGCSARS